MQLRPTKTVTSNLIWEEIVSMKSTIDEALIDTTNPILQEVAKHILKFFAKYWGDLDNVNKVIFIAHILDPCYKLQIIEMHLDDLGYDDANFFFIKTLKDCLMNLYNVYKGSSSSQPCSGNHHNNEEIEMLDRFKDDPFKLQRFMRKVLNQAEIANEVDKYLGDPFVKLTTSFNILEWWKVNTTAFPTLSMIAKDIFVIPSSTVASENAFSLGRRVVDPFMASLQPKIVEVLVCSSDWLRGEGINLYKDPAEELEFYKDCEKVVMGTDTTPQG